MLQELGFTWSELALSRYEATEPAARIPVVQVMCDGVASALFIRATPDEIRRWTSLMRAEDMTSGAFVLRRDSSGKW